MATVDDDDDVVSREKAVEHTAPWLQVPSRAISVVEHPCLIKNIDKGIVSLGGPVKLSKGLRTKLEPQPNQEGTPDALPKLISVSLRPDDALAKRLLSTPIPTNNLLLKVSVPKRTGRKRRRGSSGPFLADPDHQGTSIDPAKTNSKSSYVDAGTVFRCLRDNASRYTVSVAGLIDETHRFRTLPDIQYAASTNSTMLKIRDNVLPLNLTKLKNLDLNTTAGPDLTKDVGPSAEFIQIPVAYNYRFQQNTSTKYKDDNDGTVSEINLNKSLAWSGYSIIKPSAESVPTGPKPNLPPVEELTPYVQELIRSIKRELTKRPIMTRHLLYNTLGWDKRDRLRQAAVYCGYFFETGPWREALIAWGVDPRTDPKYRFYQTVSFLSYKSTGMRKHFKRFDEHVRNLAQLTPHELRTQHTFDGVHVSQTGNLFQFCDITDPLIRNILQTNNIRSTPSPTSQGWFHVGTWAKATVILKHKMNTILAGEKPDDSIYQRVISWPELWNEEDLLEQEFKEFHTEAGTKERQAELVVMRSVRYAARNPRYAFEKLEAQQRRIAGAGQQETEDAEDEGEVEVEEDMSEIPERAEDILNEGAENDNSDEDVDEDEDDDDDDDDGEIPGEKIFDEDGNEILGNVTDDEVDGEWEVDDVQTTFGFGGFYDT